MAARIRGCAIMPDRRRCTSLFRPRAKESGSQHAHEQQAAIIKLLLERGARHSDKDARGNRVDQAARSQRVRALLFTESD